MNECYLTNSNYFPPGILDKIFYNLTVKDLSSFSITCRRINELAKPILKIQLRIHDAWIFIGKTLLEYTNIPSTIEKGDRLIAEMVRLRMFSKIIKPEHPISVEWYRFLSNPELLDRMQYLNSENEHLFEPLRHCLGNIYEQGELPGCHIELGNFRVTMGVLSYLDVMKKRNIPAVAFHLSNFISYDNHPCSSFQILNGLNFSKISVTFIASQESISHNLKLIFKSKAVEITLLFGLKFEPLMFTPEIVNDLVELIHAKETPLKRLNLSIPTLPSNFSELVKAYENKGRNGILQVNIYNTIPDADYQNRVNFCKSVITNPSFRAQFFNERK